MALGIQRIVGKVVLNSGTGGYVVSACGTE